MKKYLLLLTLAISVQAMTHKAVAQDVAVSYQSANYQTFYDALTPYGQWVDDPSYGYVWVPGVDEDFRPYFTGGHWLMTQYGNTWVSEYPWGWACFHYGRWIYTGYYGWVWVPGNEWGPGWVSWRWGNGYCGWAPLYPGWFYGQDFQGPSDWWVFVHPRHLYHESYMNTWRLDFWRGPAFTQTLIGHTKAVDATYTGENGVTYAAGPRVADVEAVTHKPVYTYQVKNVVSPVADNVDLRILSMYRPQQVAAVGQGGVRPAPAHVVAAPQPVSAPQAIRTNWDHPHEFSASNPRTVQPAGNVNNGGGPRQQTIIRKSPPYDPPAMHHSAAPAAPRSNGGGKPAQAPASAPAKHR